MLPRGIKERGSPTGDCSGTFCPRHPQAWGPWVLSLGPTLPSGHSISLGTLQPRAPAQQGRASPGGAGRRPTRGHSFSCQSQWAGAVGSGPSRTQSLGPPAAPRAGVQPLPCGQTDIHLCTEPAIPWLGWREALPGAAPDEGPPLGGAGPEVGSSGPRRPGVWSAVSVWAPGRASVSFLLEET